MRARFVLLLTLISPLSFAELPASFIELPASVHTLLVAETDAAALHRYAHVDGSLERLSSVYMSIGENGVGKERAWDRRTPLGIYFINDRLDTTRMHERYGVLALPLDYPNAWDELRSRTGDGIWIHGVAEDGGRRPPRDTDGCLALPNEELLELEPHVQMLATPVVITRAADTAADVDREALRADLRDSLESWVSSYRDGDWRTYFSLYAEDFSFRGLTRDRWEAYRVGSAAARPLEDYTIDEILLLADPEEDGLYLSRFRQTITDANGTIRTMKRLYWRRQPDGSLRIAAEDNG